MQALTTARALGISLDARLAGVLGIKMMQKDVIGAGELLAQEAGQEQQRAAWPAVRRGVLGPPGGVRLTGTTQPMGSPRISSL